MKRICSILRKLCIGIFSIYSINILFSSINVIVPINVYTVSMSSFLGIFGLVAIIIMKLII